jgi:hypothetical protein
VVEDDQSGDIARPPRRERRLINFLAHANEQVELVLSLGRGEAGRHDRVGGRAGAAADQQLNRCSCRGRGSGNTLRPVAGDPLGEWRPSKDESLDEWGERQRWARQRPEPDGRFNTAVLVTRVACGVVLVVLIIVLLILEVL